MAACKVCAEKQVEIDRILTAYAKDKKAYRAAARKERKKYQMVIAIQMALLVLIAAFGKSGIEVALEFIKDVIK